MKTKAKSGRTAGLKPTVFVVEDNRLIRDVMTLQFQSSGFKSEGFDGMEPGLIGAIVSRADAVLLDKNLLPGEAKLTGTHLPRSGLDIAQRISEEAPWVKVALFSGEGDEPPQHMAPHHAFIKKTPGEHPSVVVDRVRSLLPGNFPALKALPAPAPKKKKN